MTSAAKPCTQSRMSFWSWLNASENVTSWPAAPAIASTAASAASGTGGAAAVGDADIGSSPRARSTRKRSRVDAVLDERTPRASAIAASLTATEASGALGSPTSEVPDGPYHNRCLLFQIGRAHV